MVKRIAILGGGISGLAAAWNLTRYSVPMKVVIFEAGKRVGGWMKSEQSSSGAVFELGPRSLRTAGNSARATMELISSVGLEDDVIPITSSHMAAKRRLIYTQQHGLVEVPSNISWLYRTKPPFTRPLLGSVLKELFTKKGSEDESIHDFISRRFGDEIVQYLVDPMCRGIFASSVKTLSLRSCFPAIYQAEQSYGSVIGGMLRTKSDPIAPSACSLIKRSSSEKWTIYTLRKGLGSFPDALHNYLVERDVQINLEQPCSRLDFKDKSVMVEADGEIQEFDHVVSALPTHVLAGLLSHGLHSSLVDTLDSIHSVTVGVVCLEYDGSDAIPQEYREAFGYLVPSTVPSNILGVVFDSSIFPQLNRNDKPSTRLTVMLGGEWFESLFGNPDAVSEETITQAALDELKNQIGLVRQPDHVICQIHKKCIPVFEVGHSEKLDFISQYLSRRELPLTATGSFYQGVSVNDTVSNAIQSTNSIIT